MLKLEADECSLVTDRELHQASFFFQTWGFWVLPINGIISFFTACFCIEMDELKAGSYLSLFVQMGKKMLQWVFQESPSTHLF